MGIQAFNLSEPLLLATHTMIIYLFWFLAIHPSVSKRSLQ
jgi:hypothetical protein